MLLWLMNVGFGAGEYVVPIPPIQEPGGSGGDEFKERKKQLRDRVIKEDEFIITFVRKVSEIL